MLAYLIKSGVCLMVFYLFYKLLLEKESFHIFKRVYLLGGLVLAFAIPLITFTTMVEIEPIEFVPFSISEIPFEEQTVQEAPSINYWPIILWTVYAFGIVVFGMKFLFNLYQIGSKIRKNTKQKVSRFTHVLLQNLTTPHTFFNYIFLNKQKYLEYQIPQEVFWHEETHAKQKHSFDVILIELLQVIFWFNPLLYFIKKDIKLNHEFLADRAVLDKGVQLTAYQEILLAFSVNPTQPQLANAFNYSSIKKRFTIMKTQTSKKAIWIKSLVLLPLVAVLVYGFSEQKIVELEKNIETLTKEVNTFSEINNIEVYINKQNELLVNKVLIGIDSLEKRLYEINPKVSFENRRNIIANIYTNENTKKGIITDIKMIFRNYGIIKMNIDGSSKIISKNNWQIIPKPKRQEQDKATYYQNVTFIFRDANKKVISSKKYSELTDKEKSKLLSPRKVPIRKSPSQNQLNEWKDSKKYGVWLDDKRIENKLLNDIEPNEVVLFYNSKLAKNAINYGKHYYQIGLYTDKKFHELYKDGIKPLGKGAVIVTTEHGQMKIQGTNQDKATPKELEEYNKLAKHYNSMSKNNMVVKKGDVERLEFIYNKMTLKQKNNAEPFPNIPPPPPLPIENESHELPPPPPPAPSQKTIENGSKELQKAFKEFSKETELYAKAVKKYSNDGKGMNNIENQYKKVLELHKTYRELAAKEGVLPTPPPPAPKKTKVPSKYRMVFYLDSDGKILFGKWFSANSTEAVLSKTSSKKDKNETEIELIIHNNAPKEIIAKVKPILKQYGSLKTKFTDKHPWILPPKN